eukprot:3670121-Amphidinium_carterae.1
MLAVVMTTIVAAAGGWMLVEQPADSGEPYTSFWVTEVFQHMQQQVPNAKLVVLDACMIGQLTPKPTAFFTTLSTFYPLHGVKCDHVVHVGANSSAQLARWPRGAMERIVHGAVQHWSETQTHLREGTTPLAAALDVSDSM